MGSGNPNLFVTEETNEQKHTNANATIQLYYYTLKTPAALKTPESH